MATDAKINIAPPSLPLAPMQYDRQYQDQFNNVLRLYFNRISSPQDYAMRTFNVDVLRMPTEANIADLRAGDVYIDTTADNALKVKV